MTVASRLRLPVLLAVVWALILPAHAGASRSAEGQEQGAGVADLTEAEQLLQGRWQGYLYGTTSKAWVISFDRREFRADGEAGDWYEGQIAIRDETEPAELDFLIEDCECKYKGMTSQGIFRWEDESLVMAAPEPGADRPTEFDESSGEMVEMRRVGETERGPAQD